MKILFLDHDGVICLDVPPHQYAISWNNKWQVHPFCKKAVRVLNEIIKATDCEIVVSSDWRHHLSLGDMRALYIESGIIKAPLCFTGKVELPYELFMENNPENPDLILYESKLEEERTQEIDQWRTQHKIIGNYCIVDDLMLYDADQNVNRFIRTDPYRGGIKQTGKKEAIIELLNTPAD